MATFSVRPHPGQWNPAEAARITGEWRRLLSLGEPRTYPRGHQLFTAGAPSSDAFLITKGVAALCYAIAPAAEALIGLALPGHLIDGAASDPNGPAVVTGVAITEVHVHRIDARRLLRAQESDPAVAALLQRSLRINLERYAAALAGLLTLRPAERLERHLHELAGVLGRDVRSNRLCAALPLRDEDMAMLVGVSARQFKRVKKELHNGGRARIESRPPPAELFLLSLQYDTPTRGHLSLR